MSAAPGRRCKARRHGAAARLGRAASSGRTYPSTLTPANRPHCHGDSGEKPSIAGAPPRRGGRARSSKVSSSRWAIAILDRARVQSVVDGTRASERCARLHPFPQRTPHPARAVAFPVQTRPCDRPRAGSSILPSFVRSALPRRPCSSVRDLALPRVHSIAFDSTLRSRIRSKAGWFQLRSNRTRAQKSFPHLRWRTLSAHVLPRWLAITIPACMLCDSTGNVCNAKERR